jgi:hypothetical protein
VSDTIKYGEKGEFHKIPDEIAEVALAESIGHLDSQWAKMAVQLVGFH